MRPFTQKVPKFLIPVLGVPFGIRQIQALVAQGVRRLVLSIGYKGELIRELLGDGSRFGAQITYCDEGTELRGTGGALRLAFDQGLLDEAFFVLYGDSYLPIDFWPVWQRYEESGRQALMTVMLNHGQWDSSNVIWHQGRIELYQKKAPVEVAARMTAIDYGLSILQKRVIQERVPPGVVFDLAGPLTELSRAGQLEGFEVTQRFFETGSQQGLADLESWLKGRSPDES